MLSLEGSGKAQPAELLTVTGHGRFREQITDWKLNPNVRPIVSLKKVVPKNLNQNSSGPKKISEDMDNEKIPALENKSIPESEHSSVDSSKENHGGFSRNSNQIVKDLLKVILDCEPTCNLCSTFILQLTHHIQEGHIDCTSEFVPSHAHDTMVLVSHPTDENIYYLIDRDICDAPCPSAEVILQSNPPCEAQILDGDTRVDISNEMETDDLEPVVEILTNDVPQSSVVNSNNNIDLVALECDREEVVIDISSDTSGSSSRTSEFTSDSETDSSDSENRSKCTDSDSASDTEYDSDYEFVRQIITEMENELPPKEMCVDNDNSNIRNGSVKRMDSSTRDKCVENEIREKPTNKCITCGKYFLSADLLRTHAELHEKKKKISIKCETCGAYFNKQIALNLHIKRMHTNDQGEPMKCGICGKEFSRSSSLRDHKRVHRRESNPGFKCQRCNECFTSRIQLNGHDCQLTCKFCYLPFNDPTELNTHWLEIHKDEKKSANPLPLLF